MRVEVYELLKNVHLRLVRGSVLHSIVSSSSGCGCGAVLVMVCECPCECGRICVCVKIDVNVLHAYAT